MSAEDASGSTMKTNKQQKRLSILKQPKSPNRSALHDLDLELNLQQSDEVKPFRVQRRVSFATKFQIKEFCVDSVTLGSSGTTEFATFTGSDESSYNLTTIDASRNYQIQGLDSLLSGKIQNNAKSFTDDSFFNTSVCVNKLAFGSPKRKHESLVVHQTSTSSKRLRNSFDQTNKPSHDDVTFDVRDDMSMTQVHGGIMEEVKFSSQFILNSLINAISQDAVTDPNQSRNISHWNDQKENMCTILSTDDEFSERCHAKEEYEKTVFFGNEKEAELEFTECVTGLIEDNKHEISDLNMDLTQLGSEEKTEFLMNKIQVNCENDLFDEKKCTGRSLIDVNRRRTIISEEDMEMTLVEGLVEVDEKIASIGNSKNKHRRQTIVFDDGEDMDMTRIGVGLVMNEAEKHENPVEDVKHSNSKGRRQTIVFDDGEEMEFTQGLIKGEESITVKQFQPEIEVNEAVKIDNAQDKVFDEKERIQIIVNVDKEMELNNEKPIKVDGLQSMNETVKTDNDQEMLINRNTRRQTIVFDDEEMEFTEVGMGLMKDEDVIEVKESQSVKEAVKIGIAQDAAINKKDRRQTIVFEDEEMEFTEVGMGLMKDEDVIKVKDSQSAQDAAINKKDRRQTIVFEDEEMEFTEVCPHLMKDVEEKDIPKTKLGIAFKKEKRQTLIFDSGEEMELTEHTTPSINETNIKNDKNNSFQINIDKTILNGEIDLSKDGAQSVNQPKLRNESIISTHVDMLKDEGSQSIVNNTSSDMGFTEICRNQERASMKMKEYDPSISLLLEASKHSVLRSPSVDRKRTYICDNTMENTKEMNLTEELQTKNGNTERFNEKETKTTRDDAPSTKSGTFTIFSEESKPWSDDTNFSHGGIQTRNQERGSMKIREYDPCISLTEASKHSVLTSPSIDRKRTCIWENTKEINLTEELQTKNGNTERFNEEETKTTRDNVPSTKSGTFTILSEESKPWSDDTNFSHGGIETKVNFPLNDSLKSGYSSLNVTCESTAVLLKDASQMLKSNQESLQTQERPKLSDKASVSNNVLKFLMTNEETNDRNLSLDYTEIERHIKNDFTLTRNSCIAEPSQLEFSIRDDSLAVDELISDEMYPQLNLSLIMDKSKNQTGLTSLINEGMESVTMKALELTTPQEKQRLDETKYLSKSVRLSAMKMSEEKSLIKSIVSTSFMSFDASMRLNENSLIGNLSKESIIKVPVINKEVNQNPGSDDELQMIEMEARKNDESSESSSDDEYNSDLMLFPVLEAADAMLESARKVEREMKKMLDSIPTQFELDRLQRLDAEIMEKEKILEEKNKQLAKEREQVELQRLQKEALKTEADLAARKKEEEIESFEKLKKKVEEMYDRAVVTWNYREGDFERHDENGLCISYLNRSLLLDIVYGKKIDAPEHLSHLPSYEITSITFKPNPDKEIKSSLLQFCHWLILQGINQDKFLEKSPTTHELYKVLNEVSLVVCGIRLLVQDLNEIIEKHRFKVVEKTLWINFGHLKAHVLFDLAFTILPNTYPDTKLIPQIDITIGQPQLEKLILTVVENVHPSPRYLCKMVSAIDLFLDSMVQ